MRRVLVLAYHFPPVGGGGVQRSLKFVRYLPEFGWQPVVVTGCAGRRDRWTPADDSLSEEVPAGLEIVRVDNEPGAPSARRSRLDRWLPVESAFARWWVSGAVEAGMGVGDVDVVYASMAPYESSAAAASLSRLFGRPWVADLRDPWALDEVAVYPTRLHRSRQLRRMGRVLERADAVVMNTPEAAGRLTGRFPKLAASRVVTIPNGFDDMDFQASEPEQGHSAFRIVHTGSLHTELASSLRRGRRMRRMVGGFSTDIELMTRSHVYLLNAVKQVLASRDLPIEVHLAGVASDLDRSISDADFVRFHGYLPHTEAVRLVRSADLLFLPMHDLPEGTRATIVPGKTYEYLASGRPILAALPDGDARDLLAEAGTAQLCRPGDVRAMAHVIADAAGRWSTRGAEPTRRPSVARMYERRVLTAKLASTFSAVAPFLEASTARLSAGVLTP